MVETAGELPPLPPVSAEPPANPDPPAEPLAEPEHNPRLLIRLFLGSSAFARSEL